MIKIETGEPRTYYDYSDAISRLEMLYRRQIGIVWIAVQVSREQDLRNIHRLEFETYGALPMPVHFSVTDDVKADWFGVI